MSQFDAGETPRSFNLGPNDNWLIAAGQRSHDLHIYERNAKSCSSKLQTKDRIRPRWVQFIPVKNLK